VEWNNPGVVTVKEDELISYRFMDMWDSNGLEEQLETAKEDPNWIFSRYKVIIGNMDYSKMRSK
jgi:hypothetical protein